MIVSSHQPSFFPWIGYWNKVNASHTHIMTCAVKLDYGGYQNRVPFGKTWLTAPVSGSSNALLSDVKIIRPGLDKALTTIRQQLGGKRWKHADRIHRILDRTIAKAGKSDFLVEWNIAAFDAVAVELGIKTFCVLDIDEPDPAMSKCARLVKRVEKAVGRRATVYLAGGGFRDYFDPIDWPGHLKLFVQNPKPEIDKGTILQLIACSDEPLQEVAAACSWGALNEQANTGDRAA